MTWTKLSDDFGDDCYQLSDKAFRLHVEGLLWSNRKLLDLKLDKKVLQRWATHPEAVTELVDLGWWTDEGDHYFIRHHACYQRSREQVLKQQAANQENGRRGGRPKGAAREQSTTITPETHSLTESLSESKAERDWSGLDRTGNEEKYLKEAISENGNGSGVHCRYCDTQIEPHLQYQKMRGYCDSPECKAEASAELAG
jgi:hypothetical protein